jgi:hypothetical protein
MGELIELNAILARVPPYENMHAYFAPKRGKKHYEN